MADNLIVRVYKNRDGHTNDYWIYDNVSGNLICTFVEISNKFDTDYVLRLHKKESKEPRAKLEPITIEEPKMKKQKSAAKTPGKKKIAKEISKFFE